MPRRRSAESPGVCPTSRSRRALRRLRFILGSSQLADCARVVLEKAFGVDLASARELNALVHEVVPEERVFRIDPFLGREAVQNVIALRIANGMFEPIWNPDHIDHVQSDVPRRSASTTAPASTRTPAPTATWW